MRRVGWIFGLMACGSGFSWGSVAESLDGAAGHVFKVDAAAKSFELLKETEYDPRTEVGMSRFTIRWDEGTAVTRLGERRDFEGFGEGVMATFRGIDAANRRALDAGEPFVARVATLFPGTGREGMTGIPADGNEVTGWFRPASGGPARSGKIEFAGRELDVSLRGRNWRIFVREPLAPEALAEGFWKVTVRGDAKRSRFVARSIEVESLPDPRETDDPDLPRVLVIGDSISMNYHEAAKEALKGIANYHRNEGNAGPSERGVMNAELWLGEHEEEGFGWDVIQFNHGLHDLKQAYDAATATFGEYALPLDDYKANLEKEIGILKKTGAKLIWCTTTPVPNDSKGPNPRRKGAAKEFNRAALEVIGRHPEIRITDLHSLVSGSPVFDGWRETSDVHFYKPEERRLLGEAVAAGIRAALAGDHPPSGE